METTWHRESSIEVLCNVERRKRKQKMVKNNIRESNKSERAIQTTRDGRGPKNRKLRGGHAKMHR